MNSLVLVNSRGDQGVTPELPPSAKHHLRLDAQIAFQAVDLLPDRCGPSLEVSIANSAVEVYR
jgi:hypothetical protein